MRIRNTCFLFILCRPDVNLHLECKLNAVVPGTGLEYPVFFYLESNSLSVNKRQNIQFVFFAFAKCVWNFVFLIYITVRYIRYGCTFNGTGKSRMSVKLTLL
jgi:hypothetical protein